jgi:glycosyltransferase involved in cell wall biosynthesis
LLLNGRDAVAFVAEDPYWERYRSARPSRLFRTIANGVSTPERGDCGVRAGDRQKAGIPSDALVVGSIGRLVGERRPDVLMDAFVGIARRTHQTHLLLGGDGPERSVLEARARELGLGPRVHLPGLVLNIAEQLSIMDLYLTIAVGPMVGIAALEAALFGLPVLAAQLLPEYHASDEDWVWSSSDPEEVAVRAIELLSNRGALRELAKRQQDHCRAHHSAEVMGQAYDRLYSDALALRGE